MKWLLSMFVSSSNSLGWRHILADLPKAITWGLLTGPLISLFFQLSVNRKGLEAWGRHPEIVFWAGLGGVVFSVSFWIAMGIGNRVLRRLLSDYPSSLATPISVVYNMVAASLAATAAAGILTNIPGPVKFEIPFFWQVVVVDAIAGGVIALVIGAFVKLKKQVEGAQAELREKELNEGRLAEAAARAQALALQAQINPHFFFNALNSISVLIDVNPSAAREMIGRLADMFRYTLNCSQGDSVALEQEMQFAMDYLAIEQARFQKRLRVEWPEDPLPNVRVPGLVMQPLVENAVKHGIAPLVKGGVVRIVVGLEGGRARVAVRNTSDRAMDLSESQLFRPGHALENVRARLRLFTGLDEPIAVSQGTGWTESAFTI